MSNVEKTLVRPFDVAMLLGCSPQTVLDRAAKGKLPGAERVGKTTWFNIDVVRQFIASAEIENRPKTTEPLRRRYPAALAGVGKIAERAPKALRYDRQFPNPALKYAEPRSGKTKLITCALPGDADPLKYYEIDSPVEEDLYEKHASGNWKSIERLRPTGPEVDRSSDVYEIHIPKPIPHEESVTFLDLLEAKRVLQQAGHADRGGNIFKNGIDGAPHDAGPIILKRKSVCA